MGDRGIDETRVEYMRRLLEERAEARRIKEAGEKAYWEKYHEQLAKGNSNSGGGAKRRPKRARPFRWGL